YSLIGKSMKRIDTPLKATGQAQFSSDLMLPRMLIGKVLRSPYAHAKILNIDTSQAERLPGVKAVITAKDTCADKWGVFRYTQDQQFLPTDRVRYVGEEVAAVAAVDEDTAIQALKLIKVEYEELPAVFDMKSALESGAPLVHQDHPGNINIHVNIDVGDVVKGFGESYYVREDTFTAPEDSYFQGEPYAVVAQYDHTGSLEIWMPNAGPHLKAKPLSNVLKIPLNKVRVRKIAIGGAFGGRSEICPADVICAFLARRSQRPVKLVYTREENSIAIRQAHSMIATIKTGVNKEGRVISRDITCHMDGGAYSSTGPIAVSVPFLCMEQAYQMDNVRYNGYRVFTNKPIRGMFRTHGRAFACGVDLQLDMIGRELGINPIEMRLRNARKVGEFTPTKSYIASCGMTETILKAGKKAGWNEKWGKLPPYHGIGIGCNSVQTGFPMGIRGGSQAFIKFNEEGGITVITGIVDNGQGNDNMIVQIAAEELGLGVCDVQLINADTEVTPSDPGSYSMCETFIGGNAVRLAAQDAKNKLLKIASEVLKASPDELTAKDRKIYIEKSPDKSISLSKVIRIALSRNESISGEGSYWPKVDSKREWVGNPSGQLSETFSFGTVITEVKVDPETGKVDVLEVTAAQDVGYALNPKVIEGQFEGGIAMGGQGGMLTEYILWYNGRVLNPDQLDYMVPLAIDMPRINNIIVETIDPNGPYGAKEAGMSIAMSAAQAYCSAICNAIGVNIKEFPLTPDKILNAIEGKRKGKEGSEK
ncbi:MAG: xanthine dehydrogenase family protein molybdopterin-binding subunit, partial [Proteobacteria bacterium]|nr:xanthine dehydrogenase family protein molybdopterin-binding subunit [Pseudomonadota bacterium]